MNTPKVLFLCTGNSARSQMAEAILSTMAGDKFNCFSAGLEPSVVNPFTIEALKEIGIDWSNAKAKPLTEYLGKVHFSYLITVCSKAEIKCPVFPGMGKRIHWPFDDPAAVEGEDIEKLTAFRTARDQIKEKIQSWLKEQDIG